MRDDNIILFVLQSAVFVLNVSLLLVQSIGCKAKRKKVESTRSAPESSTPQQKITAPSKMDKSSDNPLKGDPEPQKTKSAHEEMKVDRTQDSMTSKEKAKTAKTAEQKTGNDVLEEVSPLPILGEKSANKEFDDYLNNLGESKKD